MLTNVLPLVVFTTCSGMAIGAYLVAALYGSAAGKAPKGGREFAFALTCLVLLGVGLCATLAHLGQPGRFMNGLSNPASMIAQEGYWSMAVGVLMLVDVIMVKVKGAPIAALRWAIAAVGIVLMCVTALAYYNATGIAVWHGVSTVFVIVIGDVLLGLALYLLFFGESSAQALKLGYAMAAVWAVALFAFVLHAQASGSDVTAASVCSGVLATAAPIAVGAFAAGGRLDAKKASYAMAALLLVGVIVARCAFFAAGVAA